VLIGNTDSGGDKKISEDKKKAGIFCRFIPAFLIFLSDIVGPWSQR
jgi:hypothetical protein